eukprot:3941823-Amphidinium_carterae.1
MQNSGDPPGTHRNLSGRLVDEKGKYVKDPNKVSTSTTRRARGNRSVSASTLRDERSRSLEQVSEPEDQPRKETLWKISLKLQKDYENKNANNYRHSLDK